MCCFVKVFGGMFVLGRVATANIAADEAHAQMDPGIAQLHAILTNMFVRFSYFDLIKVGTFFCHRFLRVLVVRGRNPIRIRACLKSLKMNLPSGVGFVELQFTTGSQA
jgi:hypothetical protein